MLFDLFIVETVSHAQPFYQRGGGMLEQAWHSVQGRVEFKHCIEQSRLTSNGGKKLISYNLGHKKVVASNQLKKTLKLKQLVDR